MCRATNRTLLALSLVVLFSVAFASVPTAWAQADQQPATAPQSQNPESQNQDQALPDEPGVKAQVPTGPTAVLDTSMGRITCGLFSKEAPNTVANFIGLATGKKDWTDPVSHKAMHGKPLYNGTTFHRVIPGFMIQGGDPMATGEGGPGYKFDDEVTPDLNFDVAGRLAMANAGPNTDGSQFFITVAPQPYLDQHYSIFGQCDAAGVLVAESITQVQRNSQDKPLDPVYLKKVTIVQPGQPLPPLPAVSSPAASHP